MKKQRFLVVAALALATAASPALAKKPPHQQFNSWWFVNSVTRSAYTTIWSGCRRSRRGTTTSARSARRLQRLGALHRRPAEEGTLSPCCAALHREPLRRTFASGACSPVAFAEDLCRRHRLYDNAVFRGRQHRFCGADRDKRHRASAEPGSFIVERMRDNRLSGQHIRQDRTDPARHLHLRAEGGERRLPRRGGRHHLQ